MGRAALAVVAASPGLPLTLLLLAVAGASDSVAVVARGTVLQAATPDAYRGRVGSVEQIVGVAGPELGNFRAGLVAGLTSPIIALGAGGLLCVAAVAAIALCTPALCRFRVGEAAAD